MFLETITDARLAQAIDSYFRALGTPAEQVSRRALQQKFGMALTQPQRERVSAALRAEPEQMHYAGSRR